MSLRMEADIKELQRKLAEMAERLAALEVRRAPGRPPKQDAKAN